MGKKATHKKKTAKKKTAKKAAKKAVSKKKASKKTTSKTSTRKKTTGKKTKKNQRSAESPSKELHRGDKVVWHSLNGPSSGTVKKKVTRKTKIKSHTVDASPQEPQYLVASEKTGKAAAHKAKSLRKRK